MLKLKDLFKVAKFDFIPCLNEMGFYRYGRKQTFIRKTGDLYQLISFLTDRWGDKFYVTYDIWTPCLCREQIIDKKYFDKTINSFNLGYHLSAEGINGNPTFRFRDTDAEHKDLLIKILDLIKTYALPWFAYTSKRENLIRLYSLKKRYESGFSEIIENIDTPRDASGIKDLVPEPKTITNTYAAKPLVEFNQDLEGGTFEKILNTGLRRFVKHVESHGYGYKPHPRNYFHKESGDIHHFLDFHFENDGLVLNVAIRLLISGYPYTFVMAGETDEKLDIKKKLPTRYISPVYFYLNQGNGTVDFPVFDEKTIGESTHIMISEFDRIQNTELLKSKSLSEFAYAIEKAVEDGYLTSPECKEISQMILQNS